MPELVTCEECDLDYDPDFGCPHDHFWCERCLHLCGNCRADMKDDMAGEAR